MFWQTYLPQPVIVSFGQLTLHWYGLLMVLAIVIGFLFVLKVNRPQIKLEKLDSLFFYLVIFGIIGARLGHVIFFNWDYFSHNWLEIFKVWQGGLSILGTIITELIVIYCWTKKNKLNFWQIVDWLAPALALGQAIGRWGNYFNQELFGLPTFGWWGIPIAVENRVIGFENYEYFHPTFFYESVLCFILFLILWKLTKVSKKYFGLIGLTYLVGYSLIRFSLEFVRLDPAPIFLGLRSPQIYSLIVILAVVLIFVYRTRLLPKYKN